MEEQIRAGSGSQSLSLFLFQIAVNDVRSEFPRSRARSGGFAGLEKGRADQQTAGGTAMFLDATKLGQITCKKRPNGFLDGRNRLGTSEDKR